MLATRVIIRRPKKKLCEIFHYFMMEKNFGAQNDVTNVGKNLKHRGIFMVRIPFFEHKI
jgi:hypothetical protein